jgi:CspA family cold shock protein
MTTGKVIRFDTIRGYGFVSPDQGGEDLFIHVNDLDIDKRLIVPGVQVEFMAEEGDRGLKASHLRLRSQPATVIPSPVRQPTETDPSGPGLMDDPDDLCDVLTVKQLNSELTERLLVSVQTLTAQQILAVRECVVALAREHAWTDD